MMFGGLNVHVVEPGTEITYNGETKTVTESEIVYTNRDIYMVQAHYDNLNRILDQRKEIDPTADRKWTDEDAPISREKQIELMRTTQQRHERYLERYKEITKGVEG